VAVIPLVMFVAGFSTSFFVKNIARHCGLINTYALGATIALGGCIWVFFGCPMDSDYRRYASLYPFKSSYIDISCNNGSTAA